MIRTRRVHELRGRNATQAEIIEEQFGKLQRRGRVMDRVADELEDAAKEFDPVLGRHAHALRTLAIQLRARGRP